MLIINIWSNGVEKVVIITTTIAIRKVKIDQIR